MTLFEQAQSEQYICSGLGAENAGIPYFTHLRPTVIFGDITEKTGGYPNGSHSNVGFRPTTEQYLYSPGSRTVAPHPVRRSKMRLSWFVGSQLAGPTSWRKR